MYCMCSRFFFTNTLAHFRYTPTRLPANPAVLPTSAAAHSSYQLSNISKPPPYTPGIAGTSALGRYDPYAPPRKATSSSAPIPSSSSGLKSSGNSTFNFHACYISRMPRYPFQRVAFFSNGPSCFGGHRMSRFVIWAIVVTDAKHLKQESTGATDRRQQVVTFSLNNDQLAKLKLPG